MLIETIASQNYFRPESLHVVKHGGVVIGFNCSRAFLFGRGINMTIFYLLTSPSGKQYVGITSQSFHTRWKDHIYHANKGGTAIINKVFRKYGHENIKHEIIRKEAQITDIKEIYKLESYYIHKFNTLMPNGYNMVDGGGGREPGTKMGPEMCAKMKKNKNKIL